MQAQRESAKQALANHLLQLASNITAASAIPPVPPPKPQPGVQDGSNGGGANGGDDDMQDALPLAPGELPNKQRKDNGGQAVPGAPEALSEQQKPEVEQKQEQQSQQQQMEITKAAQALLTTMLQETADDNDL